MSESVNTQELQRIKNMKINLSKCADSIIFKQDRLVAQKVFKILKLIIGNIATDPTNIKLRHIKCRNKLISSVAITEGFRDFLVMVGGTLKVISFEEHWVFDNPKNDEIIHLAALILVDYEQKLADIIDRETVSADKKQIEQEIREITAKQFREDRSVVEERSEREKLNRMLKKQIAESSEQRINSSGEGDSQLGLNMKSE